MVNENSVKEKISLFLRQPVSKLKDEILLIDLIADSFALIEMVIELQEEFELSFVQSDIKDVKTVGDLTQLFVNRAKSCTNNER